jgi:hypothetical protein
MVVEDTYSLLITDHCRPEGENLTPLKVLLDELLKAFIVQTISCRREDSKTAFPSFRQKKECLGC